jgi:hypothetical protein
VPDSLDAEMIRDAGHLFERGEKMQLTYTVRNTHRAVGTRLRRDHPPLRHDGASPRAMSTSGCAVRPGNRLAHLPCRA